MSSVWSKSVTRKKFPSLDGNIKTDVLIIGGGMAGILCAYMLKKEGVDCVLAEAKRICSGTTENTTAKITYQHGLIYDKLIRQSGSENAALYLKAHSEALIKYKHLSEKHNCDYETLDSYVYSMSDQREIEKEVEALIRLGANAHFSKAEKLPFDTVAAVKVSDQAQFNPLKFAFSIAENLQIYENTKVKELMPGKAITENGEIHCKKIIVATHFPFINNHGLYFLKMYQHRSYVLALKGASDVSGMYVDGSGKGLSFRNYGDLLLLGGGAHRTGKKGGGYDELLAFSRAYYPNAEIVNRWAAQDCISLDKVAYIGQYSKHTPDLYVATGFNKWGMTSSMLSAMILSDLICGKKNDYARLFSPSRSILHPQLAVNAFEAAVGLLTPTVPRCPHLGCALKYNSAEHSWDCSCHGSRFSENGEVIDSPATSNKKKLNRYN